MAHKLKAGFKERHHKHLNEALPATLPPAKKVCPEAPRQEPVLNAPVVQVPYNDVVGSRQKLVVIPSVEDTCLDKDGAPTATLGGNAKEKDIPAIPSSWEEIAALLKAVRPSLQHPAWNNSSRFPTVTSSTYAMTLAWLEWFVHPMSLQILYFGALICC